MVSYALFRKVSTEIAVVYDVSVVKLIILISHARALALLLLSVPMLLRARRFTIVKGEICRSDRVGVSNGVKISCCFEMSHCEVSKVLEVLSKK